jgi:hypothetical protein
VADEAHHGQPIKIGWVDVRRHALFLSPLLFWLFARFLFRVRERRLHFVMDRRRPRKTRQAQYLFLIHYLPVKFFLELVDPPDDVVLAPVALDATSLRALDLKRTNHAWHPLRFIQRLDDLLLRH